MAVVWGVRMNTEFGVQLFLWVVLVTGSRTYVEWSGEAVQEGKRRSHPIAGGRGPARGTPAMGVPAALLAWRDVRAPQVLAAGGSGYFRHQWSLPPRSCSGSLQLPLTAPRLTLSHLNSLPFQHPLPLAFSRNRLGQSALSCRQGSPPSPSHVYSKSASICSGTVSSSIGTHHMVLGKKSRRVPIVPYT